MPDIIKPDLCIIGAGAGGLALAEIARAHGASVVLVERGGLGGAALFAGSLASKALAEAGRVAHTMRGASRFGMTQSEPRPNFRAVADHVRGVVADTAPHYARERFEALGVEVIAGEARFADRRTVAVGETLIRARRFVIAAGSRPLVPEIPGLADIDYFTTETILENTRKLTHLVIIGGGTIEAVELAQAYRRLGAAVTLVEPGAMLPDSDPELVEIVRQSLAAEGVELREKTAVTEIVARSQGVGVRIGGADGATANLDASHVLVAAGRQAEIDGLDLEVARIRRDPVHATRLFVRSNLRTANRLVYAIGDAAGDLRSAHAARDQAELVARNALFGTPIRYDGTRVPRVVFTDPGIAEIGLTEKQARQRFGARFKVVREAFAENDRARAMGETRGVARMITDEQGRIVGAGIAGPQAGELIALFALAIANRMPAETLAGIVAPYPTLSEVATALAVSHSGKRAAGGWRTRLAALNRLLP